MGDKGSETGARDAKVTVIIEQDLHAWLWRERRRRERPIAWLVNKAISQYRRQIERGQGNDPE